MFPFSFENLITLGPWEIVGCGMLGGYVGYNYNSWEDTLLKKVNDARAVRDMPLLTRK